MLSEDRMMMVLGGMVRRTDRRSESLILLLGYHDRSLNGAVSTTQRESKTDSDVIDVSRIIRLG